jgi:very-short-patch-repair endonuclease
MSEIMESQEVAFEFDSLEAVRKRLLDLTGKNRLLNFKFSPKNSLRIIDEIPSQLFEELLNENEFLFCPVPEPTRDELVAAGYLAFDEVRKVYTPIKVGPNALEWAKYLNIRTSYDLQALAESEETKHNDTKIQTLLFAGDLEAVLRNISTKSRLAIEETGANILYLSIGFLEWFESNDSESTRLAPLINVPVRIEKGKLFNGTYQYSITYTGDDLLPNLCLQEKLKQDFGLQLPELTEDANAEEYFQQVITLVSKGYPRWSVKRQAALTLLEFSKLLMYIDLDPKRWPDNNNIAQHSIISKFFTANSVELDRDLQVSSYDIDSNKDIHYTAPLIDDTDSSQHEAIIDVINNKNLVIKGPPGTGKSQTITNIIAAALAQNKKVLFVAEKMAALDVVKSRLDRAGLGQFCLELHSHKSQKRKVLEDIQTRLEFKPKPISDSRFEANIAHFEQLKNQLKNHVDTVSGIWQDTGLTIYQILTKATRLRLTNQENIDNTWLALGHQALSAQTIDTLLDGIARFNHAFEILTQQSSEQDVKQHPWYGAQATSLLENDLQGLQEHLANANIAFRQLLQAELQLNNNLTSRPGINVADIRQLMSLADPRGFKSDNVVFSTLREISAENKFDLTRALEDYTTCHRAFDSLSEHVVHDLLQPHSNLLEFQRALESLLKFSSNFSCLNEWVSFRSKLKSSQVYLEASHETYRQIAEHFSPELVKFFTASLTGLIELSKLITLAGTLPSELVSDRAELFESEKIDSILADFHTDIEQLKNLEQAASQVFDCTRLPDVNVLLTYKSDIDNAGVFRWFKKSWYDTRKALKAIAKLSSITFSELCEKLDLAIRYQQFKQDLERSADYFPLLKPYYKSEATDVAMLQQLRGWYKAVRAEYGIGFGRRVGIGDYLLNAPVSFIRGLQHLKESGELQRLAESLEHVQAAFEGYNPIFPADYQSMPLIGHEGICNQIVTWLTDQLTPVQQNLLSNNPDIKVLNTLASTLAELGTAQQSFVENPWFQHLQQGECALATSFAQFNESRVSRYRQTLDCFEWIALLPLTLQHSLETATQQDFNRKIALIDHMQELAATGIQHLEKSLVLLECSFVQWTASADGDISKIIARNELAVSNPDWLKNWADYLRIKNRLSALGIADLLNAIEWNRIGIGSSMQVLEFLIFNSLATGILDKLPYLKTFSTLEQEGIRKKFKEIDHQLKDLQRQRLANQIAKCNPPAGNGGGKVSTYTELFLLQHEVNKKTKHIPIRQLVNRAGKALLELKPCFMMGPMSVAQYLEPGNLEFDIVIMDEASQIKPEDALGTIARAKKVVIVGDPNQLPPTSFFDKAIESDDDNTTGLEQSRSILDAALGVMPQRILSWHYRSQHESLIAFSNHAFYDSKLVVFPSPYAKSDSYGVKFTKIANGTFIKGRNTAEAEVIANAARQHILNRPDESLGIVAMNAEQSELIERAIETLSKEDVQFQMALAKNQGAAEPLFIKNLENVQGDERDVIFISFTYGPLEIGGKVPNRFGPINSADGWRRLNVLFTRSKKRMHVFTSMLSHDIITSETSSRGVIALKNFLAFADTGIIEQPKHTGKEPDSDFEIAVMHALALHGYKCEPQVGVGGYFIDLAVIDPRQPGRYLLAVECDGATYHSGKTARDRDRLRQQVLESLGWTVHRIWSTDWFKNPSAEISRVLHILDLLKQQTPVVETSNPMIIETTEQKTAEPIEFLHKTSVSKSSLSTSDENEALRAQLKQYDTEVIRKYNKDTAENRRLLRDEMLDALMAYRPVSVSEFQEHIPYYIRQETDPNESIYLRQVLKIIESFEGVS